MARRFALFRKSDPEETTGPEAPSGEASSKGFGFVSLADPAGDTGDPDRPVILGSVPDPQPGGGNAVAMEKLTLANEGFEAAGQGESITLHAQYDMDTSVEPDAPSRYGFSREVLSPRDASSTMAELKPGGFSASPSGPDADAGGFQGEMVSIEPKFDGSSLSRDVEEDLDLLG